jgi:hypothetical protein
LVLVLLPPFFCLILGSSEDLGLVLGGAVRAGVVAMDRRRRDGRVVRGRVS